MTTLTPYEIPLSPAPQTLTITLAGVVYQLEVRWNDFNQTWCVDFNDSSGNPIALNLPLTTGVDLLAQLGYLNLGGSLYAQTDNDTNAVPTFANLGTQGHLYFVVANN